MWLYYYFLSFSNTSTSMVFFALLFLTFDGIQSSQMTTESTMLVGDGFELSKPSLQIIGRIMAWTCTVLYLTSRMPQIWKNVYHHYFEYWGGGGGRGREEGVSEGEKCLL